MDTLRKHPCLLACALAGDDQSSLAGLAICQEPWVGFWGPVLLRKQAQRPNSVLCLQLPSFSEKTRAQYFIECRLLHLDFPSTQGDKQGRVQLHFIEMEITMVLFNDLIIADRLEDYYYPSFTDDKTEAQRREVTCMAPCQVRQDLNPGLPRSSQFPEPPPWPT